MQFPDIQPVFMSIGPLQLRWYGLMYVIAFIVSYFIIQTEIKRKNLPLLKDDALDLLFYGALGVILGARLGYILFYNLPFYTANPLQIFSIWEGGMSFHGGFIGVITGFVIFAKRKSIQFWKLIDIAAQCAPVGLGLGRVGNFINGELYGRATELPWGIIFPTGGALPRHPSQLYESFLEGLILFIIVRIMARKADITGVPAWTFCAGYGLFRFCVEFLRQPDAQLGFFFRFFSMGQLLSLPMFLIGSFMVFWLIKRRAN